MTLRLPWQPGWARSLPGGAATVSQRSTAIDIFGGEIVSLPGHPRELAERYFNVVHWAEHGCGGHFPAVAEPQLLAKKLRAAFKPYGDIEANRRLPR
jgi:hypothetical protein